MEIGWIETPEDWRDVFIMAFMVAGTIMFLILTLFTIVIGFLSISLINRTRGLVKDKVAPAMENVKATSNTTRNTVSFISDYAVRPVVSAYGIYAGSRRFLSILGRLSRKHK